MDEAAVAAFLLQFDAYEATRSELRGAADGSDDERLLIIRCADQWNRLLAARDGIRIAVDRNIQKG